MALDKTKKILTEDYFDKDPFGVFNAKMQQNVRSSLPNVSSDVTLDKNQEVFFSFQYVLAKLLQNDKFIDNYIQRTKHMIEQLPISKIVNAFSYDEQGKPYPTEDDDGLAAYNKFLERHIQQLHTDPAVSLSVINENYLQADSSNLDINGAKGIGFPDEDRGKEFQKVYPRLKDDNDDISQTISNDFVVKTEFDDSPTVTRATNYITVAVSNQRTGNIFRVNLNNVSDLMKQLPQMSDAKYIYKEWLSGMKELYIYLPTTFTFYNETLSEDLRDNATFIRVKINKRHFPINRVYNIQVCGQSLPLMIHKDKNNYYSDVIQPSMIRTPGMSNTKDSNVNYIYDPNTNAFTFYFCCYGTDAQAIRMLYD